MSFVFGGKTYVIEFSRAYREYPRHDYETGLDFNVKSKYPYTTATVFEVDPIKFAKKIFRTATVGCWHGDTFRLEKGRTGALRLITITLPKAMKPLLWKAYHERVSKPKSVATPPVGEGDGNPSASVGGPVEA